MVDTGGQKWETTTFQVEKIGHIGLLTYSAPEKLNAGTMALEHSPYWANDREDKWWQAFSQVKLDPQINVIVITGAGRAFSAGAEENNAVTLGAVNYRELWTVY